MSDTSQITKDTLLGKIGLNIPGAITIILVCVVCGLSIAGKPVSESIGSLTAVAVGYVFRKNNSDK